MRVAVQTAPFDLAAEVEALYRGNHQVGAVVSFLGTVRDLGGAEGVRSLTLEHYPGMTEKALRAIVAEAVVHWPLLDATVIHRVGTLQPGEPIVLVAVAMVHRAAAFAACAFIMDHLKTRAPFWKKEATTAGAHWVDARESDTAAAGRWETLDTGQSSATGGVAGRPGGAHDA